MCCIHTAQTPIIACQAITLVVTSFLIAKGSCAAEDRAFLPSDWKPDRFPFRKQTELGTQRNYDQGRTRIGK